MSRRTKRSLGNDEQTNTPTFCQQNPDSARDLVPAEATRIPSAVAVATMIPQKGRVALADGWCASLSAA